MNSSINDIDELLGKYFSKETSVEENLRVDEWLSESDSNERYFNQMKLIFDQAGRVKNIPDFDTDAAWNSLKEKLAVKSGKVVSMPPRNIGKTYWRLAASVALVLGFAYFTYKFLEPASAAMELQSGKTVTTDTLPDGSVVSLNKQTQLAYSFDKKEKKRRVKLKGEAFFKVRHEEEKGFVVDAGGVLIEDIGTSFDVKAYQESQTIEVNVQEGEVKFYKDPSEGITLHAGQKGVYDKVSDKFSIDGVEPNVIAYKTRYFVYSATALSQVVNELNSIYEKKIVISDSLRNCRLTVNFNNETIEEIATVITETLGLTMSQSGNEIHLDGNGCD